MITCYQELTLLPEDGISDGFLLSRIFLQVHLGLASIAEDDASPVGVGFPEYGQDPSFAIGRKIRLFAADEKDLQRFGAEELLKRFHDDVHITHIRRVPARAGFATYERVHQQPSQGSQARRYAKRHGISVEEAKKLFPRPQKKDIPFLILPSLSNHHRFCLYIQKTSHTAFQEGTYSTYGLSSSATVPDW